MRALKFVRDFEWSAMTARRNCIFCRVLTVFAVKAGSVAMVPNDDADRAISTGAATEVER